MNALPLFLVLALLDGPTFRGREAAHTALLEVLNPWLMPVLEALTSPEHGSTRYAGQLIGAHYTREAVALSQGRGRPPSINLMTLAPSGYEANCQLWDAQEWYLRKALAAWKLGGWLKHNDWQNIDGGRGLVWRLRAPDVILREATRLLLVERLALRLPVSELLRSMRQLEVK